jgi:transketolase
MALEDLAMMRAVCGSTVLYPCDPNQTARLVAAMADAQGVVYLRTTRGALPTLYGPDEAFAIGGSKTLRRSDAGQVTIFGGGVTVQVALAAADQLQAVGMAARVIDAYWVKPIDATTLRQAAAATGGRVVVVEDHWAEGGLGDAVLAAFSGDGTSGAPVAPEPRVVKLAVRQMPGSGKPAELLDAAGISARHIVAAAKQLLAK